MWDCVRIIIPPTSCFWVYRTPQDFHIMVLLPSHQIKWPSTVGALLFQSKSKSPLSMYPWDPSFFACPMRAELAAGIGSSPWLYLSSWKYLQISFVWNTLDLISEAKQQCLLRSVNIGTVIPSININYHHEIWKFCNIYEPLWTSIQRIKGMHRLWQVFMWRTLVLIHPRSPSVSPIGGWAFCMGSCCGCNPIGSPSRKGDYLGMAIVAGIFDGEMYAYFRGQYGNFMI